MGGRDEKYDRGQATMFMDWGEKSDRLLYGNKHLAGVWLEDDVVVTFIHSSNAVGFGLLQTTRKPGTFTWVNLEPDVPIPTTEEVRFMASLKGLK
jgi:hypothetical protein